MQNECDALLLKCKVLANKMSSKEQNLIASEILKTYIGRRDFAKAEQILSEMDDGSYYPLDYISGVFWLEAYKGNKEKAEHLYYDILNSMHRDIMVFARHYVFMDKPAELIKHNNKIIRVYELLMDDFTKKPWFPLAFLHESNVVAYLKLGEKEKAFNELKEFAESIASTDDIGYPCKNVLSQFSLNPHFYNLNNREEEEEAYAFIKDTYENL